MKIGSGAILFVNLTESFFTTWALMKAGRLEPGNILTGVFFLLSFFLYHHIRERIKVKELCIARSTVTTATILSVIFTFLYMAVDYHNYIQDLTNPLFQAIIIIAVFIGFCILFYKILLLSFTFTGDIAKISSCFFVRDYSYDWKVDFGSPFYARVFHFITSFYRKHMGLCAFLFCMLFWLPYFLYQFPGIMTPDSLNQLEQVLGLVPYSNHHPWVHTMIIKLLYSIGELFTSSMIAAVSFYTLFQMCIMALTVQYLIRTMVIYKIRPAFCFGVTLFYALVPYHGIFSVTLWKDILFAAAVLLFSCSILRLTTRIKPCSFIILVISGIMLCLFRSNGWYAFLICLPFLLYSFRKKARAMIPALLFILLTAVIVKYPVMNAFKVSPPDMVESLSIPIQQVASVLCNDRQLTQKQTALIDNVIDTTYIKKLYAPTFADNMKELVRAGNPDYLTEHKFEYLKLWFQLGATYPADYITAYINQTYGYWYPDCFYPVAEAEGVSGTGLGVSHTPLISGPLVVKTKEIALKLGDMIPIYSLLWSMGIIFWIFLFCIGNSFVRKESAKLVFYLPSIALFLTVMIATPVATEFRYVYFMIFSLPFYVMVSLLTLPESDSMPTA